MKKFTYVLAALVSVSSHVMGSAAEQPSEQDNIVGHQLLPVLYRGHAITPVGSSSALSIQDDFPQVFYTAECKSIMLTATAVGGFALDCMFDKDGIGHSIQVPLKPVAPRAPLSTAQRAEIYGDAGEWWNGNIATRMGIRPDGSTIGYMSGTDYLAGLNGKR